MTSTTAGQAETAANEAQETARLIECSIDEQCQRARGQVLKNAQMLRWLAVRLEQFAHTDAPAVSQMVPQCQLLLVQLQEGALKIGLAEQAREWIQLQKQIGDGRAPAV